MQPLSMADLKVHITSMQQLASVWLGIADVLQIGTPGTNFCCHIPAVSTSLFCARMLCPAAGLRCLRW